MSLVVSTEKNQVTSSSLVATNLNAGKTSYGTFSLVSNAPAAQSLAQKTAAKVSCAVDALKTAVNGGYAKIGA